MRDTCEFSFVGSRRYVRAIDVLRQTERWTGQQAATYDFTRPLRSNATITDDDTRHAAVKITLEDGRQLSLRPEGAQCAKQDNRPFPSCLLLRLWGLYVVFAPAGMAPLDLIDVAFEKVHPTLARRFLVKRIDRHFADAKRIRALWFRIHADGNQARILMRRSKGSLVEISCRLIDWAPSPNSDR